MIETRKLEIDRIVLKDLVHFKEEHSEESASSYYSNESSENKETEEKKGICEHSSINSYFKRIWVKADKNWLFSCLDTLCFNGTYGAREMRLLIVNYIRNNQNMFKYHVDGDFNYNWNKMELDKTWGTYTELLAFSTMLEIDIDVYGSIQWVKPLISLIKELKQRKILLLYTKWSYYYVLYPLEKKEIISFDKSKISKVK